MSYVQYVHHGKAVWVQEDLKGKHKEHCLCYGCEHFIPDSRGKNCRVANYVYKLCTDYNLVLPVWECPTFLEPKS